MVQLFSNFEYASIPLQSIILDPDNPRIVTQIPLTKQSEIINYLFQNENLAEFISQIIKQGKNAGAERPYVLKSDDGYTVKEGNTRIAAYQLLCGLESPPKDFEDGVPAISEDFKNTLLVVDCTIVPSRDKMLGIMAHSHFGTGDKSKWGYLGSRKAVFTEYKNGKTIAQLSRIFERPKTQIVDYLLEFLLYQEALKLDFNKNEKQVLLNPAVEFNPPVRFLQSAGHKEKVGVSYDRTNISILFDRNDGQLKFRHLISKLVVSPQQNLGATASYDAVFIDYTAPSAPNKKMVQDSSSSGSGNGSSSKSGKDETTNGTSKPVLKNHALFNYPVTKHSQLLETLMKEAKTINSQRFPAASTFLLRNIVEALLKEMIQSGGLNPDKRQLMLSACLDKCIGNSNKINISKDERKVLVEFKKNHLSYLNLGAHGNLIPNYNRVLSVRDAIDQFLKAHI